MFLVLEPGAVEAVYPNIIQEWHQLRSRSVANFVTWRWDWILCRSDVLQKQSDLFADHMMTSDDVITDSCALLYCDSLDLLSLTSTVCDAINYSTVQYRCSTVQ